MTNTTGHCTAASAADLSIIATSAALDTVLQKTAEVVQSLDTAAYTTASDAFHGGSVGAHVRHCLDHLRAVLAGIESGTVDYDDRRRATPVEVDPAVAVNEFNQLRRQLVANRQAKDQPLKVRMMVAVDQPGVQSVSTLGRELAFVLSHTIHHGAMIAAMITARGGSVPQDFGFAPSTLAHLQDNACAQ